MELYSEISKLIRQIYTRYTDKIEPLSLDEAYLDVSDCELFAGSATLIAEDIRRAIYAETQLTGSAGGTLTVVAKCPVYVSEVNIAACPQNLQHSPDQLIGSDLSLAFDQSGDPCKFTEERTIKNLCNLLAQLRYSGDCAHCR
jgi:hypothetical protein